MVSTKVGHCRSCRRQVLWAKTVKTGSPMPLDEDADRGNVVLDHIGRAEVFANHEAALAAMEGRLDIPIGETYISHHAAGQCPQGPAWQGRSRQDPPDDPELGRAREFAQDCAARREPHSGAIEAAGAVHVEGSEPEAWRVGGYLIVFEPDGVRLRRVA